MRLKKDNQSLYNQNQILNNPVKDYKVEIKRLNDDIDQKKITKYLAYSKEHRLN